MNRSLLMYLGLGLFCFLVSGVPMEATEILLQFPMKNDLKVSRVSDKNQKIDRINKVSFKKDALKGQAAFLGQESCVHGSLDMKSDEWKISFSVKPEYLPVAAGKRKNHNQLFTLTGDRTVVSISLVHYADGTHLLACYSFLKNTPDPAILQKFMKIPDGRWFSVELEKSAKAFSLKYNNEILQTLPCSTPVLDIRKFVLGATSRNAFPMMCSDLTIEGVSSVSENQDYSLDLKSRNWEIQENGDAKLTLVELPDNSLKIIFNGGDGSAVLKSRACVRGVKNKNHIRAKGEYTIIQSEYGSVFRPMINNLPESRIMSMSGDKPYPPGFQMKKVGDRALFDFSWPASANIGYHLKFFFTGNPSTVILHRILAFEPQQIIREGRPKNVPENRRYNPAEVDRSLALLKPVRSTLKKRDNTVELFLDGKKTFPAIYYRLSTYPEWSRYANFRDAGIYLYGVQVTLGEASYTHRRGIYGVWKGKGKYDFSKLKEELRIIHSINPKARVRLTLDTCFPYRGWAEQHPTACFTNAAGQIGCGATTSKWIYYKQEEIQRQMKARFNEEWYFPPSLYGKEYQEDVLEAVAAFTRFLETDDVGKIVFAVHIYGGADGQFFPYDRDQTSGEDHSLSARTAWKEFLLKKYKNTENLRRAWGDSSASFATAHVPNMQERGADRSGRQPTVCGKDYTEFISQRLTDFRLAMFRTVKRESKGRLLTGSYFPPGFKGNHDFDRIISAPETDFLIDIQRYTPAGTFLRFGKLHISEQDHRVDDAMAPIYNYTFNHGHFKSIVRSSTAQSCLRMAGGYHLLDLSSAYFYDKKTSDFLGKTAAEIRDNLNPEISVRYDAGVFFDYRYFIGHAHRNQSKLEMMMRQEVCYALERSGIPFQIYTVEDLLSKEIRIPKMIIFPYMPELTENQLRQLRSIAAANHSIIIWGYYAPFVLAGEADRFGYHFSYLSEMRQAQLRFNASSVTRGIENKIPGRSYSAYDAQGFFTWFEGVPAVVRPRENDIVLGSYKHGKYPGMIMRSFANGAKEIVNGAPGAFSPQFFRNIAELVHAEYWSANDQLVVMAANGILSILCEKGGRNLCVKIPPGCKVVSSITDHDYRIKNGQLFFDVSYDGDFCLFKLDKI